MTLVVYTHVSLKNIPCFIFRNLIGGDNMKNIYFILAGILVFAIVSAGLVMANGYNRGDEVKGQHFDAMQPIVESGTYDDLVQFRAENGRSGPRWIDSPEKFVEWQEMHANGGSENCPYRSAGKGSCGGCPFAK